MIIASKTTMKELEEKNFKAPENFIIDSMHQLWSLFVNP